MARAQIRFAFAAAALSACASGPSPRWQSGGAALPFDAAYWNRGSKVIELRPSGEVIEEDTLLFRIDRSGRLSDPEGKPVAVLLADGNLVAEDDGVLGWIGPGTAYGADRMRATVQLLPNGQVLASGTPAGSWTYCEGAPLRACTLVTHVVAAREAVPRGSGRSSTGLGGALQLLELLRLFR